MANKPLSERIPCYCALCISHCGATAVIQDGRFVALEPDPSHPTGKALCAKGRAAPELVYHPNRLQYPLRRTRPKGDPDPGWQRISWDEAFDITAAQLRRIAEEHGPESGGFSCVSPSTSASDDSVPWITRLMNAFGSPNLCAAMELCGWGRYFATQYTFGASVPGNYMPDLEQAGCILFWGYNPNVARLVHATATVAILNPGGPTLHATPASAPIVQEGFATAGAMVTGRTTFEIAQGWGGHPPIAPCFVVTHVIPSEWSTPGSKFTFVTEGIASAIRQAKQVAGDKKVVLSTASTLQQALNAQRVDELDIDLVPVMLSGGVRLFDNLDATPIHLEITRVVAAPAVTHMRYRVVK